MNEHDPINKRPDGPSTLEQISQFLQGQPLEVRLPILEKELSRRASARRTQRARDLVGAKDIVFSI